MVTGNVICELPDAMLQTDARWRVKISVVQLLSLRKITLMLVAGKATWTSFHVLNLPEKMLQSWFVVKTKLETPDTLKGIPTAVPTEGIWIRLPSVTERLTLKLLISDVVRTESLPI